MSQGSCVCCCGSSRVLHKLPKTQDLLCARLKCRTPGYLLACTKIWACYCCLCPLLGLMPFPAPVTCGAGCACISLLWCHTGSWPKLRRRARLGHVLFWGLCWRSQPALRSSSSPSHSSCSACVLAAPLILDSVSSSVTPSSEAQA